PRKNPLAKNEYDESAHAIRAAGGTDNRSARLSDHGQLLCPAPGANKRRNSGSPAPGRFLGSGDSVSGLQRHGRPGPGETDARPAEAGGEMAGRRFGPRPI